MLQGHQIGPDSAQASPWHFVLQNYGVSAGQNDSVVIKAYQICVILSFSSDDECQSWHRDLQLSADWNIDHFYDLTKALGSGTFGKVFSAIQRRTRRIVAVKAIRTDGNASKLHEQHMTEISALTSFDHPNVMRCTDVLIKSHCIWLVQPLMHGGSIGSFLRKYGRMGEGDARYLARHVIEGLCYVHERGVVHRDLKPDNIFMQNSHFPSLACIGDFGASGFLLPDGLLAETNWRLGTANYIAPEVIRGERYGTAIDMWALGVSIFKMLSDSHPFVGKSKKGLDRAIVDGSFSFSQDVWGDISYQAKHFILRLLTMDIDRRITAADAKYHDWILNEYDSFAKS